MIDLRKLNVPLKTLLDERVDKYDRPEFIINDPISIPHRFTRRQDIEIMGFFAAILAWGQRKTIISKCLGLIDRMDGAPYEFVTGYSDNDLKNLLGFKHRTFNDTDLLYFIHFFRQHYSVSDTLEDAFLPFSAERVQPAENFSPVCFQEAVGVDKSAVENALNYFRSYFFSLPDYPRRTVKHITSPRQKSTCKRLNMYLRWMVRDDGRGVDFGLWKRIPVSELVCPCDVHVDRVARALGLITRKQTDWLTALELTAQLRKFDASDPVKYDFALFGLGVEEGAGKERL